MRLAPLLLPLVLAVACREAKLVDPTPRPRPDAGIARADGGARDATSEDAARLDAGALDGGGLHDAANAADATSGDASTPADAGAGDAGPVTSCEDVRFTLSRPGANTVWVTGSFSSWGANPAAGALELSSDGAGGFGLSTRLARGRHLYKFIVDGTTWIEDPSARDRESDGFGGFNSVIEVCTGPAFVVSAHNTDSALRTFTASVEYRGGGSISALAATLDLQPVSVQTRGNLIGVNLTQLTDGIHDLRLAIGDDEALLKIYVNESTDWRDTVMYFAMIDRFRNGDRTNDAPVGGALPLADYLGGDFAGLEQAIDEGYFDRLGVNSLWITWPANNPEALWPGAYPVGSGCSVSGWQTGPFSGYHGYWPTSGRDIEARFGTMAELQRLVTRAHARGIRVLLDFTANHVHTDASIYSSQPAWFNQPPVMCGDGHWDSQLREECWFEPYLADWNYTNAAARAHVIADALWLAKKTGADGFRVDALKHMEDAFIRELRRKTEAELELTGVRFYMVGETFTGDVGLINRYVQPDMMHAQFDFPANYTILQGLARNDIGVDELHRRVRGIKAGYGASAPLMSTFIGNHDIARFISVASGDLPCGIWSLSERVRAFDNPPPQPTGGDPYRRLELAMTYNFTLPGIPLVYYGDEVGLAGAGDPDNRRMLPASLNAEMTRTRGFMERLGAARASHTALRQGGWTDALWADTTVLVFARTLGSEVALVALNRGDARTITVDLASLGLTNGAMLDARLGMGAISVSGTSVTLDLARLGAEIWTTR